MQESKVEVVDINDLIPDDHNFNKGNEQGQELMERSFREHGAGRSILLDKNGRVIAGNKSQKAAIAASIYDKYPHDGKYIIKGSGRLAIPDFDVTVCQSHMPQADNAELTEHLQKNYGIRDVIINPLGEWTGGPDVDCGATNRKLGSDMGDGVTGGGLHGKDLSKADVSVNIWCYLESIRTGHQVTACCSIGDESVGGVPYADIVEQARLYIHTLGGFEAFACWGLIRPNE